MADTQELPLFTRTFDFITWLLPVTNNFPRAHRHTATKRLLDAAFNLREHIEAANHRLGNERMSFINQADEDLDNVRLYLRQFFPSIDHAVLRETLTRKISDPGLLWLCDQILASGAGVLAEEYEMTWFAGDDLFAASRPRGLPIGNLTSQFWANVLLNPFDHFVKRKLGCAAYLRYVDDFLLFARDKQTLWRWLAQIELRLGAMRLTIHPEAAPRPVTEGFTFLGFQIFPQQRRLKRQKGLYYQRKLRVLVNDYTEQRLSFDQLTASVQGWSNHVRFGNTIGLRKSLLGKMIIPPPAKET